jgi:hypothetical protein
VLHGQPAIDEDRSGGIKGGQVASCKLLGMTYHSWHQEHKMSKEWMVCYLKHFFFLVGHHVSWPPDHKYMADQTGCNSGSVLNVDYASSEWLSDGSNHKLV